MINGIFLQGWILTAGAFLCLLLNNFPTKCCLTSMRLITATAGTFVIWWRGTSGTPSPPALVVEQPRANNNKETRKNNQEKWDCILNAVQGADLGAVRSAGAVQSLLSLLIIRKNVYSKYFFFLELIFLFSPFLWWTKKVAETFFLNGIKRTYEA